jgi:hypothetical protein
MVKQQLLACVTIVACAALTTPGAVAEPLAHTFSIVARDATTGEIGVAVQSHSAAGLLPDGPALVARIQALAPSRTPRRR